MPYEIPLFENEGGDLAGFRGAVEERCPGGTGPSCLVVVEDISEDESSDEGCIVDGFSYNPEPGPPDVSDDKRKLKRGTTVTAAIRCPPETGSSGSGTPTG